LFIIGLSIFFGCTNENTESDNQLSVIEEEQEISFEEYINLIPDEQFITDNYNHQGVEIKANKIKFVNFTPDKIEEIYLKNLILVDSFKSYSINALKKLNFHDCLISVLYQFKSKTVDYFGKIHITQLLYNYDSSGKLLTILPIKFQVPQNERIINCHSKLTKDQIVRFYNIQDTTKQSGIAGKFYNNEYIEYLKLNNKGEIEILGEKKNVLDAFANTYVKVGIEDKRFRVYNPCKDSFHIIRFIPPKQNENFQLHYKDENKEFKFEIISTYWISGERFLDREFKWKYEGDYINLWLKHLETGDCEDGFLAIGSANDKRVHEFHFTDKYKDSRLYYTDYKNVLNGIIKIQKPDCE
jgi:hypothetical protein